MDIHFTCTKCGQRLEIDGAGAGLIIQCPTCTNQITVPNIDSKEANPDEQKPAKKKRQSLFSRLTKESIFEKNTQGETRLHQAVRQNKITEIPSEALSQEIFLAQNELGRTPLHHAAQYRRLNQIPVEFLNFRTLSIKNSGGNTPLHVAATEGCLAQIPREVLSRDLLSIKNNIGMTPPEVDRSRELAEREAKLRANAPPELATDRQKEYLIDLGVSFDVRTLTKDQASELIDGTLRSRPPSQRQLEKIKRLGLLEDFQDLEDEKNLTMLDAREFLQEVLSDSPSDAQITRAKELGFVLRNVDGLTVEDLDNALKLADQPPTPEDLAALKSLGLKFSEGTALSIYLVRRLADIFDTDFEFDFDATLSESRRQIACACLAATNDESFSHPIIDGENGGEITWPKVKLREWVRLGKKS